LEAVSADLLRSRWCHCTVDYGDFPHITRGNTCNSNCKKGTKNCTLPQNSLKCEESNGVIFARIGEEISLPILFKVASLDEALDCHFDDTSYFHSSLSVLCPCCWWC